MRRAVPARKRPSAILMGAAALWLGLRSPAEGRDAPKAPELPHGDEHGREHLLDRCARIRERSIGEVHRGEPSGRRLDALIETLLAETVRDCSGDP